MADHQGSRGACHLPYLLACPGASLRLPADFSIPVKAELLPQKAGRQLQQRQASR